MSLHRRATKRDANEPAIVSALEALGCVVWRVSGKGLPDLIILRAGKKWLADVKGPKEKPTPAQEKAWDEAATKARCAVFILRTPEDAAAMLNNALQPWEPEAEVSQRAEDHIKSHAERKCACYPSNNQPRKGDAAKAREEGLTRLGMGPPTNGSDAKKQCGCLRSLGRCEHSGNYTPPRSKPVDAAKEAEATFAPKALKHNPACPDCVRMQRWCAGCCY